MRVKTRITIAGWSESGGLLLVLLGPERHVLLDDVRQVATGADTTITNTNRTVLSVRT